MSKSAQTQSPALFQVIELHLTEKDIEKEHHYQLRRWKETHGDLHSKSPPRMHGAKAIIIAEPPRLQDLRLTPNIKMETFQGPGQGGERGKLHHETEVRHDNSTTPSQHVVNPGLAQPDPLTLLKHSTIDGSRESMSSAEHDTYL